MIELKNIYKSFGGKEILNDISAVMQTGMTNLIIGTSGSGKTVLQKCMVGLFEVDKGESFLMAIISPACHRKNAKNCDNK